MHRRTYEAREVLRLLGVKPHVLRYWEQSLPIIRPRRNESGYRVWNGSQLRMLLRIRHLVVERGMSVAAAGNEILHEAEPGTADTKARLEALRSRLITLLLYNRAAADRERGITSARGTVTGTVEQPLAFPLCGEALTVTPLIPARRERRETAPSTRGRWIADSERDAPDSAPPVVHVPLSHLSITSAPRETARILRSMLRRRVRPAAGDAVIVPAPAAAMDEYRDVFAEERREAENSPSRYRLLPIFPVTSGSVRWWSPRMSLFIALATDAQVERWLEARRITTAYIWAPEDPSLPAAVSSQWSAAAASHAQGVAIAVQPRRRGVRLPEATVLHLPTWRPALAETLVAGRWRMGRAQPDSLVSEPSNSGDGAWTGGWRFDLWQRDLLELAPPRIKLPPPTGPVPWYGEDWRNDVTRIWRDLELRE
ncbi:MAG: MerR family transcriptional regulator [Alkalispirochaeta sp.]